MLMLSACSRGVEGTWYQENNYYGYSATMTIAKDGYEITTDTGGTWEGSAQVDGSHCTLDDEHTYELSSDGNELTCLSSQGTDVYAGAWYPSFNEAKSHARRQ